MLLSLIVLSPYMMWTVQQVGAAEETTIFGSKYLIKNPQQDFPNGTGNAQGNYFLSVWGNLRNGQCGALI